MSESKSDNVGKLKKVFSLLWRGAIFGAIALFVLLAAFWFNVPFYGNQDPLFALFHAFLVGAILGLPSGAIGGLLVGSVWKNNQAPIIGGIVLSLVVLVTIFFLIPDAFFGSM